MLTKINFESQIKLSPTQGVCKVATTTNISFSGITTIDGVGLVNNDRILVWQQSLPEQNGIYIVSGNTNLVRASDASNSTDFKIGQQVFVYSGSTNGEKIFYLTTNVTTIGVSSIVYDVLSGLSGSSGSSGTSGSSGGSGSSGTSGTDGTSGSSGTSGASGSSGNTGASGSSGTSGASGSSGNTGASGTSGTSGSNAGITSYTNPADNRVITSVSSTAINAEANLTFDGSNLTIVAGDVKITAGSLSVGGNLTNSATDGRIDASNDIVAFSTSDRRLKENITNIENPMEKILSLNGVEFDWVKEHYKIHGYDGNDVGVIAQDLKDVLPQALRINDSGYYAVRYEKIIPLLIECIKELNNEIKILKEK